MDNRAEITDFLATRRARLTPEQVGLPASGRRRVPGLRREEVAVLAGVSTDWYTRLERGHIAEVSDDVLASVCRALRLDEAERSHLDDLARAARPSRAPRRRASQRVRPSVQWMLDAMTGAAAIVPNGSMDLVAANALGRALYSPVYEFAAGGQANIARFQFLDPRARDFHQDWPAALSTTVAIMRTAAGRDPHNRSLTDLVGSWPPAARSSAAGGPATTSGCTTPAPRRSCTPSSAGWTSPSSPSRCPPTSSGA